MSFFQKFTLNSVVLLVLTAFTVIVAAVFRNPLLVYTSVFLITTNVVLYVWAQYSVRGLTAKRVMPRMSLAGQPTTIGIELTNLRSTPRYGILGFDLHPGVKAGQDYSSVAILEAPQGQEVLAEYTVVPQRRGEFDVGPFYLYGGDPFGFYKCWRKVEMQSKLLVLPAPFPFRFSIPQSVSLLAKEELETVAHPGESTEFLGVREYVEGEPLKRVHWRTSARLGKLISRQYEMNVAASISTLVIVDSAMVRGTQADRPLEYSLQMVASLAHATMSDRFHLSYLSLIGERHETHSGTGSRFYRELAVRLARLDGYGEADWQRDGKYVLSYLPQGSSLIVFCADINEETRRRLTNLSVHFANISVVTFNRTSFERSEKSKSGNPRMYFGDGYLIHEVSYGDNLARVLEQILSRTNVLGGQA